MAQTTAEPRLASLLLSSKNPAQLVDWYRAAFDMKVAKTPIGGYDVLNFGGFYVMVDTRSDIGEVSPEPGRIILNINTDDARGAVERIDQLGAHWLAKLEDRDGSLFATAIDPDGNYIQLIQLSEEHKAMMENA